MTGDARIRPLRAADLPAVRRLFRDTIALGGPLPFDLPGLAAYEALCLDWYLGPGREAAAVLSSGDQVLGYSLVCLDGAAYRRWAVPAALTWAAGAAGRALTGGLRGPAATFVRLRVADGLGAWHGGPPEPAPAHAHVNLARGARRGAGFRLVGHIDRTTAAAGLPGWYGEINARAGRRALAVEHRQGHVVHRAHNRTLSWLAGEAVERLTVLRRLAELSPEEQAPRPADAAGSFADLARATDGPQAARS